VAHARIFCPSCKASCRVPARLRNRAGRSPRCRARLILRYAGGETTAWLAPSIGNAPRPPAVPHFTLVGDTAVDVPASAPTRWDLHALT
jgi:hypothetical protein